MPFITRINFQDNRQHILPERKTQELSGITEFGLPFSALTYGPDMSTSASTSSLINVVSTFSGNTGTTVFTFGDNRMDIADTTLSAITPLTSAITQDTGYVFVGNTSTVIDGNTVYLDYTGTSFDFSVTSISEPSAGIYTGTAISTDVFFFSAGTLDYLDRMIWARVNGILQTNKLIVVDGAQTGYVLTALNNSGDTVWSPSSTGSSSYWSASTGLNAIVPINTSNTALGNYAIAIGNLTQAKGNYAFSEGYQTNTSGDYGHSEGYQTKTVGDAGHAEGRQTTANANYSHAEGYLTTADGPSSHAEGYSAKTTVNAFYGHAEGYQTLAKGDSSHAEGYKTTTDSTGSHAEGYQTTASGTGAHSEGFYTQALTSGTHAEGYASIASGLYAHAEGYTTQATADYSHAQGFGSIASGISSFASGSGSTASGNNSFVHSHNSTVSGTRSVVLGGSGATATQDETVYVPNLVVWESYTPSASTDTYGVVGQITWDDNNLYWKTNSGWLMVSGMTF